MPHNPKVRIAATTRIVPALPRRTPSRVGRLSFFVDGGFTSRLLCAKPAAPTQIDEHEHDDPHHALVESHVVITTHTDPINSRARGVGWVAWFALALRERARLGGKCQKAPWCCGALVMELRLSCPRICARPARPLRCFVRCRGTAHHLRQVRHISWLLSRERSDFPSENDQLTSRRPPTNSAVSPPRQHPFVVVRRRSLVAGPCASPPSGGHGCPCATPLEAATGRRAWLVGPCASPPPTGGHGCARGPWCARPLEAATDR